MTEELNFWTEADIDWGNPTDKPPEVGYISRMIVIHPRNPYLQEQLERLNTIMVGSGSNSQDFIFITREELEMRRRNIGVLLYIALTDVGNILNETVQMGFLTNSILCKISHRPDFPYHSHPKHRMKSVLMRHSLPAKLTLPRGIHRDGRGRLQKQNLTSSRLSRRNGSRK